jgi:hypothetical protein
MKKYLLLAATVYTLAGSAQVPSYVPTNGLIGWWSFNGNTNDESGNNNNGTNYGAVLTTDRFGNDSSAYLFDGTSSYISIPSSASLESPTTELTMSAWIYLNGYSLVGQAFDPIMTKSDNSANAFMYRFTIDINGVSFYAGVNDWSNNTGAAYTFSLNEWHLLTAVLDSFNSYFYLDDSLVATNPFTTNINNNTLPLEIGRDMPGITEVFNGKLDDVGIWNRALTQNEIADMVESCTLAVTTQPTDQSDIEGSTVQFTVASNDVSATFQWQMDSGSGFNNITNGGQYSGATIETLTVSNIALTNDGEDYRAVVTSDSCSDISDAAVLTVLPNGTDLVSESNFMVFPNPASDEIVIQSATVIKHVKILNAFGQEVKSVETNSKIVSLSVNDLVDNIYFIRLNNSSLPIKLFISRKTTR